MKAAFPHIKPIAYEGPQSKNPLAFKHYNADEIVDGKTGKTIAHRKFAPRARGNEKKSDPPHDK